MAWTRGAFWEFSWKTKTKKKLNDIQVKIDRLKNTVLNWTYLNNDCHYCDILLRTYHDKLAELEYLGKFVAHTARGKRERLSKYYCNHCPNYTYSSTDTVCNGHMRTCPSGVWLWPESSGRWRSQTPPHWGASGWSCCSDTGSHWCDSLPRCHWWTWASASATPASGSTHRQEHSEPHTITKSWRQKFLKWCSPAPGSCWALLCKPPLSVRAKTRVGKDAFSDATSTNQGYYS